MRLEDFSFPTSIDGIGDEVLFCFLSLGFVVLIYGVWITTSVDDRAGERERQYQYEDSSSAETESEPREAEETQYDEPDPPESEETVRIRLKFLDESVKEVRSHLSESFGRFKRRHFPREIEENQMIRLVFNGRFLQGDSTSLNNLGLFDNCVCHVLIQSRPPNASSHHPNNASASSSSNTDNANTAPSNHSGQTLVTEDLDLSTLCYPLLGSLLSLIWWCQIVYGQYFNLTSTMSLIFITGLYIFCLAGQLY